MKNRKTIHRVAALAAFALMMTTAIASADPVMNIKNNRVGVGTTNPLVPFHVVSTTAGFTELTRFTNNGIPGVYYEDTSNGKRWGLQPSGPGDFTMSLVGTGGAELIIRQNGNLQIRGTLVELSSRAAKENFTEMNPREVLEMAVGLEVSEWNYKNQKARHIGPMAEDFHGLFDVGQNGRGLAPRDLAGVNLLALQGLNEVVEEKNQEIDRLTAELAELRTMVEALAAQ